MTCSCEDIRALVREELERIMAKGGGRKKKRSRSGYNVFMGECRREGKDMKTCAGEYKVLPQAKKDALKAQAQAGRPPDAAEEMLRQVI